MVCSSRSVFSSRVKACHCRYPAGFVYIFTALYYITNHGADVRLAQYLFAVFYLTTILLVFRIYNRTRKVSLWKAVLVLCCLHIYVVEPKWTAPLTAFEVSMMQSVTGAGILIRLCFCRFLPMCFSLCVVHLIASTPSSSCVSLMIQWPWCCCLQLWTSLLMDAGLWAAAFTGKCGFCVGPRQRLFLSQVTNSFLCSDSLAVSVKMNVLLFAPGLLFLLLSEFGLMRTIPKLSLCAGIQVKVAHCFTSMEGSCWLVLFIIHLCFYHSCCWGCLSC